MDQLKSRKFNEAVEYTVNKISYVPVENSNICSNTNINGTYVGDGYMFGPYVGDDLTDYNKYVKPDNGWTRTWPSTDIQIKPWTTPINTIDDVIDDKIKNIAKELEELKKNKEPAPNKVDKDLVNGKLPYNVLVDINKNLQYDFAVAGYSEKQIKIIPTKDGLEIKLSARIEDDDLIGEEKEYMCKGIKDGDQTEYVFIDRSKYDVEHCICELDYGILHIMVPYKENIKINIKKKSAKVNL